MKEKREYEFRSLQRAEPLIKKLISQTALLSNPDLYVSIGRYSGNAEKLLKMAGDCNCNINVYAVLGPSFKDGVLKVIEGSKSFKLKKLVIHFDDFIPNYLVSDAGYYLQNGIEFDEAVVSFKKKDMKNFLISLFEDEIGG
ncbi:hypothetical protein [Thalassospira sp. CH_XMU1448-2]|uniref:hypothetical protein n=1 Tax=Thalassospira sp. CH_XMU1448-2 TaxID=3107773 RepID=UPI003009D39C